MAVFAFALHCPCQVLGPLGRVSRGNTVIVFTHVRSGTGATAVHCSNTRHAPALSNASVAQWCRGSTHRLPAVMRARRPPSIGSWPANAGSASYRFTWPSVILCSGRRPGYAPTRASASGRPGPSETGRSLLGRHQRGGRPGFKPFVVVHGCWRCCMGARLRSAPSATQAVSRQFTYSGSLPIQRPLLTRACTTSGRNL